MKGINFIEPLLHETIERRMYSVDCAIKMVKFIDVLGVKMTHI